jgi:hypothetical protein
MIFKKLQLRDKSFNNETLDDLIKILKDSFKNNDNKNNEEEMIQNIIYSIVLTHNVTPVFENNEKVYQGTNHIH